MTNLAKTLRTCASSLILAAAIGAAAPAFAQDEDPGLPLPPVAKPNYPPAVGPDGLPRPTTPLGGSGEDIYGQDDPGLPPPPPPKGWKGAGPAGGQPGHPGQPAQQAGGNAGATAAAPPLPVGAPHRPQLERTAMVGLPGFFCSDREKSDWLLGVFYPAATAASKNNIAAHNHLVNIRRLRDASTGDDAKAYGAEYDAWEPIWRQGDTLASAFARLIETVQAIPVIDCGAGVADRGGRNRAALLGAAMQAKPVFQVGAGSYADFGQRTARPFDGSEAEHALREGMRDAYVAVKAPARHDPVRPQVTPLVEAPVEETVSEPMIEATAPVETAAQTVQPPAETFAEPTPPVVQTTPDYPLCPDDGMPATPEHIRQFHS
ncbi:MAG: hypothetical protein ABW042_11175 [Phenylobacterium sp.]